MQVSLRTPEAIVDAIVAALDGKTVTGRDDYSLSLEKSKDPTDVTAQGSVWSDGAFVVLMDTSQEGASVPEEGTSPAVKWKARHQIVVEVLQRIPSDPAIRWSNIMVIPRRVQNLLDVGLETSTQMNWAVKSRSIPMTTKEPGKDFYRMRFRFAIEQWWDHN